MPEIPLLKILLIDQCRLFVEALAGLINARADMHVVGLATSVNEALPMISRTQPDVLVLDTDFLGGGMIEVVDDVSQRRSKTKIVLLASQLLNASVEQAFQFHAAGYLMKSDTCNHFIDCLQRVAAGEIYWSQAVQERALSDGDDRESRLPKLTGRQLQVLLLLAEGDSVKEIAKTLHLSPKSIDSHKYRLMRKLGIHDRVKLAHYAIREGLISP